MAGRVVKGDREKYQLANGTQLAGQGHSSYQQNAMVEREGGGIAERWNIQSRRVEGQQQCRPKGSEG